MRNAEDHRRMKRATGVNQASFRNQANSTTMDEGSSWDGEVISAISRPKNENYSRYAASCPSGAANIIGDGNLNVTDSDVSFSSVTRSVRIIMRGTESTLKDEDRGLNFVYGNGSNTNNSHRERSANNI